MKNKTKRNKNHMKTITNVHKFILWALYTL